MKNEQYQLKDYQLDQIEVRLKLSESRTYYSENPITDADSAVQFMSEIMKDLDREWVSVLNLDTRMRPINYNVVSIGNIDSSIAPIQNIMKSILMSGTGKYGILLHTHPSGDPTPSEQDLQLTRKAVLAGMIMDLPIVDHIILACETGKIYSIRSNFPHLFSGADTNEAGEKIRAYNLTGASEY